MSLETPRDLFIHELSDSMSAEHIMLSMLGELEQETEDSDFRKAVSDHRKETEQQIRTLEKVFDLLGEKPEETTCPAAEGLRQEHEELKKENPPQMILELGNLAGAGKSEHYEMATYTTLVQMAKDLGEKEIEELLKESLQQEKEMARTVEKLSRRLGKVAKKQLKESEAAAD